MELIYKEKLINDIKKLKCRKCEKDTNECYYCVCERVFDAPAVDAVEVVRCKDCKHWFGNVAGYTGDEIGHCERANWMVGENGYCVYGERKNADN